MAKNHFMQLAASGLELPEDILHSNARIDILGRSYLRILNHRGIMVYGSDRITVRLADSILNIGGTDLAISQLDDEQITVVGKIDSLIFEESSYEI